MIIVNFASEYPAYSSHGNDFCANTSIIEQKLGKELLMCRNQQYAIRLQKLD